MDLLRPPPILDAPLRSRSAVAVAAVAIVGLLLLAGGVYAYDSSRGEQIAEGISIAGVDVGGMTGAAAQRKLERQYLAGLQEPVVVHRGEKEWKLGPKESQISANVPAMVHEAVLRSDEGGMLKRTWRRVSGGGVEGNLQPDVSYSRPAVTRLVDRVRSDVETKAVDAKVDIGPSGVSTQAGKTGRRLSAKALSAKIREAIVAPGAKRTFSAKVRTVQPDVTEDELAEKYPVVLIADRSSFKLKLYKDLELSKTYGISVGSAGHETPAGEYKIANKAENPAWNVPNSDWAGDLAGTVVPGGSPENPLKARWLGIYDGVGIHGTSDDASIGTNASHGCLRMHVSDVIDLYPRVPVGAPIYIA